jgi:hypothetical protein
MKALTDRVTDSASLEPLTTLVVCTLLYLLSTPTNQRHQIWTGGKKKKSYSVTRLIAKKEE